VITYPYLRTQRIAVQLRELTLGDSIALLKLPGQRLELCTTELLKRIASKADAPRPGYITDPRLWTVEERAYLVANYLTMVTADGPDFSIGERRMSDYLGLTDDLPAPQVDLGEVCGQATVMVPLVGVHAEVLEVECTGRMEWIIGAMACQLHAAGKPQPDLVSMSQPDLMVWLRQRMAAIKDMPESDFERTLAAFFAGQRQLYHFVVPIFGDDGLMWACRDDLTEGGAGSAPARFQPLSCVSPSTRGLFGRATVEAV
jgi:hypothetical protein